MANLIKQRAEGGAAVRMMLVGEPSAGKTGALAALANAGYKLRVLDFDGNTEPLSLYAADNADIDAVYLEDKMRLGPSGMMEPVGIPTAYTNALKLMDEWKYTEKDGTEVNLGPSKEWGPDTVVVVDSLTSLGEACMRRAMKMANKTRLNMTHRVWGFAAADQNDFIDKLTSKNNRHHVIVLSHLKMIGPKETQQGEDDIAKTIKEASVDLIPVKLYPSAVGWQLPQFIGQHFPSILKVERKYGPGQKVSRILRSVPSAELDLKVPAPSLPNELDISDGLVTVFKALGSNPPTKGE